MNIQFNGSFIETMAKNLTELLLEQGFGVDSHVATAVDGQFVAKSNRDNQVLNDGDQIEVVAPMQGG